MRTGSQWRWAKRRGRVLQQAFTQKQLQVFRVKVPAHAYTQSCRWCFTVEANMLLDMEWLSWKNYKTKTDTSRSDRQPRHNRMQTRLSNPSVQRRGAWNKLRYSGENRGRLWPPAAPHLSWLWDSHVRWPGSPRHGKHKPPQLRSMLMFFWNSGSENKTQNKTKEPKLPTAILHLLCQLLFAAWGHCAAESLQDASGVSSAERWAAKQSFHRNMDAPLSTLSTFL